MIWNINFMKFSGRKPVSDHKGAPVDCNRMKIWPESTDHSLEWMYIDWLSQLFVGSEGRVTVCNQRGFLLAKLEFTQGLCDKRGPVSFYIGAFFKDFCRCLLLWNKMAASLLFFMFAHVESSHSIIEPDGQYEMPANKDSCLLGIFVSSNSLKHWNPDRRTCQWL